MKNYRVGIDKNVNCERGKVGGGLKIDCHIYLQSLRPMSKTECVGPKWLEKFRWGYEKNHKFAMKAPLY